MRKCLLFVTLFIVSQFNNVSAQSLFTVQDTICIKQLVTITNRVSDASTYYWGFCSGFLQNNPIGSNMGNKYHFNGAIDIQIAKDGDNYYGFTINSLTDELLRLNYGTSLSDTPTVTNLGNLTNMLPVSPTALFLLKDSLTAEWFLFVGGGTDATNSTMARIDFRTSLANETPNIVNFGNRGFNVPKGIFIAQDHGRWSGYYLNAKTNSLGSLDFGFNIANTPIANDWGTLGNVFSTPSDLAAVYADDSNWYLFVTNMGDNTLTRVDLGHTLASDPTISSAINLGDIDNKFYAPSSISLTKDCGSYYAFITDQVSSEITRVSIPDIKGPYTARDLGNLGDINYPTALSWVVRDHDNLFSYVTNSDNTLTQIEFPQCSHSSLVSSNTAKPPAVKYDSPGHYNLILVVDEGLPTQRVECKDLTVLPIPDMILSHDTTVCQGDTVNLSIQSVNAIEYSWSPYYRISDSVGMNVQVWPDYSLAYHVTIPYPDGCVVDTSVKIGVSKIMADAGPDRVLVDGAKTLLGGPLTSMAGAYTYSWTPDQYLSDASIRNPVASPIHNYTYYLKVSEFNDTLGCTAIDTVVVKSTCSELVLPNAFAPAGRSNAGGSRFGVMNRQIAKLNTFKVFDRWGQLMFETTDITKEWDGTYNGKDAPMGVYVWEADGFCNSGLRLQKSGNVTLIR